MSVIVSEPIAWCCVQCHEHDHRSELPEALRERQVAPIDKAIGLLRRRHGGSDVALLQRLDFRRWIGGQSRVDHDEVAMAMPPIINNPTTPCVC